MGGCNKSDEVTTILNLSVHCPQQNARFSQQLTNPLMVSSYIRHAVSVQNSSGSILGCGRLESHFPVFASYRDQIVLQQNSQYHQTRLVAWSRDILDIFKYTVLESVSDTCLSDAAIFDPWKPPPKQVGRWNTTDQFKVGDFYNRWRYNYYIGTPLIGNATILGHGVCHHHDTRSIVTTIAKIYLYTFRG